MHEGMNTTDVIAALAADPQVQKAKRVLRSEQERLERLLAEQAGLTAKLAELPATPETRKKRADLRAMLSEVQVEIPAAEHEIRLAHRLVQRAERVVAAEVGSRITGEARALGQTIFQLLVDLVAEFRELQALEILSHTARSVVGSVDRALGEETPVPPGVLFSSGLDHLTWNCLIELAHAIDAERARLARIAEQVQRVSQPVG